MKHLCLFSIFIIKLFAISVGFNYSYFIPKEAFYKYDYLVINPNVPIIKTKSKLIAYISIEEQRNPIDKSFVLKTNKNWNTYIMDIRNKEYQKYLLEKFKAAKNFDGFFLDTLDSYLITKVNKKEYKESLIKFIRKLKKLYPDKIFIFNRGFELIEKVKPNIIVAENLINLNNKPLKENDRKWLINNLNKAKKLGIEVVVIEYINPFNIKKAKEIAKEIKKYNFNPYIADPYLKKVGIASY